MTLNRRPRPADTEWVHREPDELDLALAPILPAVCGAVALLDAVWTSVDLITLTGPSLWLALASGLTAVLLAGLSWLLRADAIGAQWSRPLSALVVLSTGLNGAALLAATRNPQYTAWLLLATVGAGMLVLGHRWYLGTLLALWIAWSTGSGLALRHLGSGHDAWVYLQLVVVMIAATAVSALLHHQRTHAVTDLIHARADAQQAAVRDAMTGVANYAGLTMLGSQVLDVARRHGDAVYAIVVDIDGLGAVNEELGRLAGDEVIVGVADALNTAMRSGDVVARWGGDEFVVIGTGAGPSALEIERRVRAGLVEAPPAAPSIWPGRVSAGRAVKEPWDDDTLETLLARADREMLLRRALRREAGGAPYRPATVERSNHPPTPRHRGGPASQTW